ncbi:MAG: response regulator [Bryobacteraceae bacterium]|nr:response regulator [Bryobacteraceae bacterium]
MPNLLLVDDNEMNCDMLARRLSRRGFVVAVANDGASAIEMARTLLPDLILMDLVLPVMDGTEAAKRLKSDRFTRHIPIIALTAHAMEKDREQALLGGFDDYDTKPVDFPRLLDKIAVLTGTRNITESNLTETKGAAGT